MTLEPTSPYFIWTFVNWALPALIAALALACNTTQEEIKLRILTGASAAVAMGALLLVYVVVAFVFGKITKALSTIVKSVLLVALVLTALLLLQEYGSLVNLLAFRDWAWDFVLRNLQKYGILKVSP